MIVGLCLSPLKASAISGTEWHAGQIIDDAIFTNKNAMSVADIQTFLNQKVGTTQANGTPGVCDTNGVKTSEFGGGTRAQWGAAHGVPAPYTCLKDYYEVPKTTPGPGLPASNYGGASIPAGAISAAQIIYNAAQQYSISPKVLLTVLQKESTGPLVTDDWPTASQYVHPMGAHCPDSNSCDPNYFGFSMQIFESARLFRSYLDNMDQAWWGCTNGSGAKIQCAGNAQGGANPGAGYKVPYTTNFILWSPNTACGGSNIYMTGKATTALYMYTPYQPNAAALANVYGGGDGCSAYGNRNFWRMYNDWFGPSTSLLGGVTMTNITQSDPTPARGETVTYVYSLTNNLPAAVTLDAVGVVGRLGSLTGANRDFGWQGPVTLSPNTTQQFTFSMVLHDTGVMYAWPAVLYQGTYVQYNNWGEQLTVHEPNLSLTSPLNASTTSPIAGQTVTFTATVKNNEPQAISAQALGIPIRYYGRYNYDTAWTSPAGSSIDPGASATLSGSIVLDKPGPYTAWVSGVVANQYTTLSPNLNLDTAVAVPKFSLTYIETPDVTPAIGEDVTVKFKLKNNSGIPMTLDAVGAIGRYGSPNSGTNDDLGWVGPVTFADGEEKSFTSFTTNINKLQNYYTWVAVNYQGSYIQYTPWGFTLTPHVANIVLPSPISINGGTKPTVGQTVPVTVTIKNNEPHPIRYAAIGIPIRFYSVYNYDATWQGPGTLAPAGQSGDTVSLSGSVHFDKPGPYTAWTAMRLTDGSYITLGDQTSLNL